MNPTPTPTPIPLSTSSSTPIFLTPYQIHDIVTLPLILSIPSIAHNLISVPQPYTLADAEWWVNTQLAGTSNANLPLQVIRTGDPETGQMIGAVSLMPNDSEALKAIMKKLPLEECRKDDNECELGYYLHPDWQGKRIITAAVRELLKWGKEELGVENVVIKILEENVKSRSVVERLEGRFLRCEEEDSWIDWPEKKGGGRRKLLVWRWTGSLS